MVTDLDTMLPDSRRALRETLERELEPHEKIKWCGRPRESRYLLRSIPLVVFGIVWMVPVCTVSWGFYRAGDFGLGGSGGILRAGMAVFVLPFVLVGLGMLSSPIWVLRKARRTVYAVTDRRAILIEGGWSLKVRSFPPQTLLQLERKERPDGSGDIILERLAWRDNEGTKIARETGFIGIPDVRQVETMLRDLARQQPPQA